VKTFLAEKLLEVLNKSADEFFETLEGDEARYCQMYGGEVKAFAGLRLWAEQDHTKSLRLWKILANLDPEDYLEEERSTIPQLVGELNIATNYTD